MGAARQRREHGGILLSRFDRIIVCGVVFFAGWMTAGGAAEAQTAENGVLQPERPDVVSASVDKTAAPSPAPAEAAVPASPPAPASAGATVAASDNDPPGTVRVVGILTDIGKRYGFLAPNIPIPPFKGWHQWFKDREISVHCALEWKDEKGKWWFAEMRSSKWDHGSTEHRVGLGQFPGTGYIAYGIFITPGRVPREIDLIGRTIVVHYEQEVKCDYRQLEYEIRNYGAYGKKPGDPGTGGTGRENVCLGGPAYKPAQNSNTLVNYVLRKCGVHLPAPEMATGWDTIPSFPYSTNTRFPKYDNQP